MLFIRRPLRPLLYDMMVICALASSLSLHYFGWVAFAISVELLCEFVVVICWGLFLNSCIYNANDNHIDFKQFAVGVES